MKLLPVRGLSEKAYEDLLLPVNKRDHVVHESDLSLDINFDSL